MPATTSMRKRMAASVRACGIFSGELHDLKAVASTSKETQGEPGRVGDDEKGKTSESQLF